MYAFSDPGGTPNWSSFWYYFGSQSKLAWHGDLVDMSKTIRSCLGTDGRLVTFGAYTLELECDILLY